MYFPSFGKFLAVVSSKIASPPFSLSDISIRGTLGLISSTSSISVTFSNCFTLCAALWRISNALSFNSVIFSQLCLNMLSSLHAQFIPMIIFSIKTSIKKNMSGHF